MARKFTAENTARVVATLRAGGTLADACEQVDVAPKTVEGWLARGRRDEAGPYADFVKACADARAAHAGDLLDFDEYLKHLAKAVRSGSVQAMKLWWDIHRQTPKDPDGDQEPADPFGALDEAAG